jgi:hypothetical protein
LILRKIFYGTVVKTNVNIFNHDKRRIRKALYQAPTTSLKGIKRREAKRQNTGFAGRHPKKEIDPQ